MASSAVHNASSAHRHSPRRPGMVVRPLSLTRPGRAEFVLQRVHHTWHGETPYRSHFEDFMREIGVDAQATHLCCVPRQGMAFCRVRDEIVN